MASEAAGYPDGAEAKAKVKKPRPPPPPPPPALATASLLVRGAAARVFGLQPGPCGGELQTIWQNEPGCTKLTMSLEGTKRAPFPKDELHGALLTALEAEANRLATEGGAIAVFEMNREEAEAKYGNSIYEPAPKPEKKSEEEPEKSKPPTVRLAHLPGAALVEIKSDWTLCSATADCGKIDFLQKEVEAGSKKKPETMIMACLPAICICGTLRLLPLAVGLAL